MFLVLLRSIILNNNIKNEQGNDEMNERIEKQKHTHTHKKVDLCIVICI